MPTCTRFWTFPGKRSSATFLADSASRATTHLHMHSSHCKDSVCISSCFSFSASAAVFTWKVALICM